MKCMNFLFRILLALIFIITFQHISLFGQILKSNSNSDFMRIVKTQDMLYVNDSTICIMNKSPLEVFQNYKNIYDSFNMDVFQEIHQAPGGGIRHDGTTRYYAVWYIKDDLLCMVNISFNMLDKTKDVFPNDEQYTLMEDLTGGIFNLKFEFHPQSWYEEYKYDRSKIKVRVSPFGAMPATWFNDSIIVKRARRFDEEYCKWAKDPCRKPIFHNGKLVSTQVLNMY